MTRVRYWIWRVPVVGISALLLIMGYFCLPDQVRASAVLRTANLSRYLETEFTSALSSAFALVQTEFHTPRSSAAAANPEIPIRSSHIAENFDIAHRLGPDSFLAEDRDGSRKDSIPEIATAMLRDRRAERTGTHDALAGDPQTAGNFQNPNEHFRGGTGGSSGVGGANGSGRSVAQSGTGSARSRARAGSGHLRIDLNQVHSSVSSRLTAGETAGSALAGSFHGLPMNGETVNISANKPSGEGGASIEGGITSKDARRDTVQSSPGSSMTPGFAAPPTLDSANMLNAGNSEATLLRDLGSEDRTGPASGAMSGADELDAGRVSIPGNALDATIPDLPGQTEAGVVSGVIAQDLFGSDGSNAPIAGDQSAVDILNAFQNNYQLQDQAAVDATVSAPEPASLLLFGAALIGTITFAKIERLWQSPM